MGDIVESLRRVRDRLDSDGHLTLTSDDHRWLDGAIAEIEWFRSLQTGREDERLPCDVMVPPRTIIRKGGPMSTLVLAIKRREGRSDEDTTLPR